MHAYMYVNVDPRSINPPLLRALTFGSLLQSPLRGGRLLGSGLAGCVQGLVATWLIGSQCPRDLQETYEL